MYEADEVASEVVATPGSMLDYVAKKLPEFLPIIKEAGRFKFYNATERSYTLFVPKSLPADFPSMDPNTSLRILNMSTVPGVITTKMLSNNMIVYPLAYPKNNLHVTKSAGGVIKVEGHTLTEGDIICVNGIIHVLDGLLLPAY